MMKTKRTLFRVNSLSIPTDMGRISRKIGCNFSLFTAEQLKNWVIIYSMFALRGMLSPRTQLLASFCYLLCRRRIDINKADLLFVKFCSDVERLYGAEVITPNMHLHCHMADHLGSAYGFWWSDTMLQQKM